MGEITRHGGDNEESSTKIKINIFRMMKESSVSFK
jgi:hypothetical protein